MFSHSAFFSELFFNLIVAAASGALTVIVVHTKQWLENRRIERIYPIAGEYISTFEDRTDKGTALVSARAVIHQRGSAISGKTWEGTRCWVLEGKIAEDNYIYGRYTAESPYDRGNGNFYLEIRSEGELKGLWSGFDSINGTVEAGAYRFKKIATVSIEAIDKRVIPGIIRISQRQLGESFLKESDLLAPDLIGYCATQGRRVVGFILGRVMTSADFCKKYPHIAETVPLEIFHSSDKIGFVSSMAVESDLKRQGIGSKLMAKLLGRIDEEGAIVSFLSGWKSPEGLHIGGVARGEGFEEVREIADFYKEGSLKNKYRCPVCGDPPCHCSAVVMMRTR